MLRWLLKAKILGIDFPRGPMTAAALVLLSAVVAALGWQSSYGACLPGDQVYCAQKLLISAFRSIFGLEVPFDFDLSPALSIGIARILGATALAIGTASYFLRRYQSFINAWLASFTEQSVVVTSSDGIGAHVASHLPNVVQIADVPPTSDSAYISRTPSIWRGHRWVGSIRRRLFSRAEHLLFLEADTNSNIENLERAISGNPASLPKHRNITVRVENFWRRKQIQDRMAIQLGSRIETMRCFATGNVAARNLLCRFPTNFVIDYSRPSGTASYWIIGEGDRPLELLLAVARQSPSRFYAAATIRLFAPNAERAIAELSRHSPALTKFVSIEAHELAVEFPDTATDIVSAQLNAAHPTSIYLALRNSDLNAVWRGRLAEAFRRSGRIPPLILVMPTVDGDSTNVAEQIFGPTDFKEPATKRSETRDIARLIQGNYLKPLSDWAKLSFDSQEENRARADHLVVKARDIFALLTHSSSRSQPAIGSVTDARSAELIPIEHQRWLISQAAMGWTFGEVRQNDERRHPLLLPWRQLPDAARDKNAASMQRLHDQLTGAGRQLTPMRVVVVRALSADTVPDMASFFGTQDQYSTSLLLLDISGLAFLRVLEAIPRALRFGLLLPTDAKPADLPSDSPLAPENIQSNAIRPWCIVRLVTCSPRDFATDIGADYVEI